MSHVNGDPTAPPHQQACVPGNGAGDDELPPPTDGTRPGPLSEAALLGRKTPAVAGPIAAPPTEGTLGEYRALVGLLLGYALLICGNGLFQTLIPLRMLRDGDSTLVVGFVQSSYYLGFLLGALLARRLIDRIGQHRVFIAFSAAAAILAITFSVAESATALALIRLLTGFAFMGLYSSIESWLNGTVSNDRRGQIFGSYTAVNYLALAAGQMLLNIDDPTGSMRFSLTAVLFAAAVIPVSLLEGWPTKVADASLEPMREHTSREIVVAMMQATPLAVPGCVLAGFLYSGFYSLMPVYLARSGFTTSELSMFMGSCLFGALATQWPTGRLSDRTDRRRLVYRFALLSLALSAALALFPSRGVVWVATIVYVAVTFTQYGLIVSHTNDRAEPHLRVAISSMLLVLFSIGGMTGPAIASLFMTALGPRGLFVFNALTCAGLSLAAKRALGPSR
ncbi:MFS transporter [Paraburkholderia tropica]|uniref:MFS transporter n=1 Tax=Paraburkholderia tropica TaxID=92647 RepID=UPI002AB31D8E|nr:MFS transporter [Paraburkholderia tropica]